ncbi:MAG TPA: S8 family serine peptidase, partial [Vicinamibacterales bacterium]|nr:S8 family serine peptidase [Vicinamibacterales bacterium]
MKLYVRLACLLAFFVTAAPLAAQGRASKLDKQLQRGCTGTRSVIIRTKPGFRESLRNSLNAQGRFVTGEFPALDAVTVEVPCSDLAVLARFGGTDSISDNASVNAHALTPSTKSITGTTTSLTARLNEAANARLLQQANLFSTLAVKPPLPGTTSTAPTIGVAVIDSGIQPGIDFGPRITASYDFTLGRIRAVAPSDSYGHGTHVAGVIAGSYVGVAPTARLISLKVLDGEGKGTTDNVVRAIEFAIANKSVLNIHVLNLSLGHPIYESAATDPLVQAVEHATRSGLVVVVSAGNFGQNPQTGQVGYAGIASPGNAPSAFSVGTVRTFNTVTRDDDRVAAYSSRGPSWYDGFVKPDFLAPGDNLLSVAALGSNLRIVQERRGNTGNYMRLSGTSMAAGVASGMVAVVLQ